MSAFKKIARGLGLVQTYDWLTSNVGMVGAPTNTGDGARLLEQFLAKTAAMQSPSVLELGTKQSVPGRSTKHAAWIPHAREYLGTDISHGADVDIVADVHRLSDTVGRERFDVIVSCSTFEHLKYPHLAAHEIMKSLKVGGVVFIQTHQSFPIHAYPYDYFRFSREAMSGLFGTRMGVDVIGTAYEFPARIYSRQEGASRRNPAYLNVLLLGEKTAATPEVYEIELDH
jgi:Methyltransferase domain